MENRKKLSMGSIGILSSLLKIAFAASYLFMALSQWSPMSLSIIVLMIVFVDILDGRLADWRNTNTLYGRLLDSASDKLVINFVVVATVLYHQLPLWFYMPILVRDIIVIYGGIDAVRKYRVVVFPNWYHKISILFIAVAGISILLSRLSTVSIALLSVAYTSYYISMPDYFGIVLGFGAAVKSPELSSYYPTLFVGLKTLASPKPFQVHHSKP